MTPPIQTTTVGSYSPINRLAAQPSEHAVSPPVPLIAENNFALIAQRLYLSMIRSFHRPPGQTAGEQVLPQTRNSKERDLTNYIPPELPN